jgi:hypothetical protein
VRALYYTALHEDQEYSSIRPLVDWLDYNGYAMVTKPTKSFTDALGRRNLQRVSPHKVWASDPRGYRRQLTDRGIPFVIYSGINKVEGACKAGTLVGKPATGDVLVATAEGLLPSKPAPN